MLTNEQTDKHTHTLLKAIPPRYASAAPVAIKIQVMIKMRSLTSDLKGIGPHPIPSCDMEQDAGIYCFHDTEQQA